MGRVIHFEIHGTEPEKLVSFYAALFGWKIQKWGGPMEYWLVETGPENERGINGGILKRKGSNVGSVLNSYVCTVDVKNLDESFAKGQALGGSVALPKMPVPGIGWLAYLKDPDGNVFGMMQADTGAK